MERTSRTLACLEGIDVELGPVIVKTPGGKGLLVLGIVEAATRKAHAPTLKKILAGLRPHA